jgi:hypothetical protein
MKGALKSIIETLCVLTLMIYVLFGVLLFISAFLVLFDIDGVVEYLPLPMGLWVLMIFGAAAALFLTPLAFAIGLDSNSVLPKIPAVILTSFSRFLSCFLLMCLQSVVAVLSHQQDV